MSDGQDQDYNDDIRDDTSHHATVVFEREILPRPGEARR